MVTNKVPTMEFKYYSSLKDTQLLTSETTGGAVKLGLPDISGGLLNGTSERSVA